MARSTLTPLTPTLALQRAQALHVALDAGTVLRVVDGRVRLHAPMRWLGDAITTPVVVLSEGEAHRMAHGGWVRIEALNGAALLHHEAPVPGWQAACLALKRGLGRSVSWLRRPTAQNV